MLYLLDDILEAEYKEFEKYVQLQKTLYSDDSTMEKGHHTSAKAKQAQDPATMMSIQEEQDHGGEGEKEEHPVDETVVNAAENPDNISENNNNDSEQ